MSFLSTLGKDVKGVFSWLGSARGQQVIATGEAVAEVAYPPATAIINLINPWIAEIVKTEALATAAGAQNGSGVQKAAAVASAIQPAVLQFAQQAGVSKPTEAQIAAANTALVAFLNAFGSSASTPAA